MTTRVPIRYGGTGANTAEAARTSLGVAPSIAYDQANTAYGSPSDIKLKENIVKIENAIEKINSINGYYYNYIGKEDKLVGVIAQEVEKVLPEVVYEYVDPNNKNKESAKAVRYELLTSVLIEAVKEQQKQIKKQQKQIDELILALLNKSTDQE